MRVTRSTSVVNHDKLKDSILSANGQRQNASLGDVTWVRIEGSSWWPAQVVDEANVRRKNKPQKKSACETLVRVYGTYDYLYVDLSKCRSEFENAFKHTKFNFRKIFQEALEALSCSSGDKAKGEIDAASETCSKTKSEREVTERSEDADLLSFVKNPSGKTDFDVDVNNHTGVAVNKKIGDKIMNKNVSVFAETTKRYSKKRKAPGNVEEDTKGARIGGKTVMQNKEADSPNTRKNENGTRRRLKGPDCTTVLGNDLRLAKTPDSSVRRIRMMQRLALIAPEGSPFNRNGICSNKPDL